MNPQIGSLVQVLHNIGNPPVATVCAGIVTGNVTATTADLAVWVDVASGSFHDWVHLTKVKFDPSLSAPETFAVIAGGV